MMLPQILALLAAAASFEPVSDSVTNASLGVTATVIRPVEISSPSVSSEGAAVTIRNTSGIEVLASGALADTSDPDTAILTGNGAAPMVITLVY